MGDRATCWQRRQINRQLLACWQRRAIGQQASRFVIQRQFLPIPSFRVISKKTPAAAQQRRCGSLWRIRSILLSNEAAEARATFIHAKPNDADSISCVSQCTQTVKTSTTLRLFAPSRCAICLEEKGDVMRLMHKCNHPSACISCLRTDYVEYGLKDTANFPLQCFWPGCNRILRDVQVHPLAKNKHEMNLCYKQPHAARSEKQAQEFEKARYN